MALLLLSMSLGLVLLLPDTASAAAQWMIVDPPQQGTVALPSAGTGAAELSGITWGGGDQFYVVGDNASVVYPLAIALDPTLGIITAASLSAGVALAAGGDLEGLAYDAANGSVYASDESGPAIREHALVDGSLLQTIVIPAVYSAHRPNLSLESLSRMPNGDGLWTANEEALSVDGGVSSSSAGTTVRLQKFDAGLSAAGQWAYVTDPIAGDIGAPGRDFEVSGVSDLVALPDGGLLVLERELGVGGFRLRIYEVDFSAATDVTGVPSLASGLYTPVAKVLLWETFGVANFEGISLGPLLANQAQSLLLVSDNGGGLGQSLLALVLLRNTPVCSAALLTGCRAAGRSVLTVVSREGEQDKLTWGWRKGTVADLSVFGDPFVTLGHGFSLCVYDTVSGAARLRIGAAIPRGDAWLAANAKTLRYLDRAGSADGVIKVKLRSGTGKAEVRVKAKGATLGVPSPPPSGTLLSRDPDVTVQFVNRDVPTECFSASYSSASRERHDRFKASY